MNAEFLVLAGRIQQDLIDVETIVSRAERAVIALHKSATDQDLFVDAAALNLHDFYAAIERSFEHIVRTVDGTVPTGRDWHQDLLQQVSLDIPDVRPVVITQETAHQLDEFLRFRHVVRHNYAFEMDAERIERLVKIARDTLQELRLELQTFIKFLNALGQP